jgi:hypothetical protein
MAKIANLRITRSVQADRLEIRPRPMILARETALGDPACWPGELEADLMPGEICQ